LFLAFLSVLFLIKKDKLVRFFSLLICFLLPLIYQFPFVFKFVLPFSHFVANHRLLFVLAFCFAFLAAKFVDLLPNKRKIRKTVLIFIVLTFLFLPFYLFALDKLGVQFLSSINPQKASLFLAYQKRQTIFLCGSFVASLFLIYMMVVADNKANKNYLILVGFFVFLQTGFLNRNYNPVIEKKYFYPQTEELKFLQTLPPGKIMELGGNLILPANVNLWYNLAHIQNYDALNIKRYKILFDYLFDKKTKWGTVLTTDNQFLDVFGVKYVLTDTQIDKKIIVNQPKAQVLIGELVPGKKIVQRFVAQEDNLIGIRVLTANYNRLNTCHFTFILLEVDSSREIFRKKFNCADIFDKNFLDITFPKITDSYGKKFEFSFITSDAEIGNAVSFWANKEFQLVFMTIYDQKTLPGLRLIYDGKFKIYENTTALPLYFFTPQAVVVDSHKALRAIKSHKFDLKKTVLLEKFKTTKLKLSQTTSSEIKILTKTSTYDKIKIKNEVDGYLVTTRTYFPGWKVLIDGKATRLLKANFAFGAVFVPKGAHIVEFIYRPKPFVAGVIITFISLFLFIVGAYLMRHHYV
jgi:hypothetical protein